MRVEIPYNTLHREKSQHFYWSMPNQSFILRELTLQRYDGIFFTLIGSEPDLTILRTNNFPMFPFAGFTSQQGLLQFTHRRFVRVFRELPYMS